MKVREGRPALSTSPAAPLRRGALRAGLGAAAFVLLAFVAPSAGAAAPKSIALLGVQFLNDHEAEEPTTDAERLRLASLEAQFKAKLEASARYKFIQIPAEATAKIASGAVIGSCGGCEYDYGAQLGGDLVTWIVVQKVSNLILNLNVYIGDVKLGKIAFVHSVDIRGNTDESWSRGITYLVKNYLLADPP